MDENMRYKLSACLTGCGMSLIGFNILYTAFRYSQSSHLLWKQCLVGVLVGFIMFIIGVSIDKTHLKTGHYRRDTKETHLITQTSPTAPVDSTEINFCPNCGTSILDRANFCTKCGKQTNTTNL